MQSQLSFGSKSLGPLNSSLGPIFMPNLDQSKKEITQIVKKQQQIEQTTREDWATH